MEALSPAKTANQRKIAVGPHDVGIESFGELCVVRRRHIVVGRNHSFVFGEIDGVIARLDEKIVHEASRKRALLLVERDASCESPELRLFLPFFLVPERIRNRLVVKNEIVNVSVRGWFEESGDGRDFDDIELPQVHTVVHFLAERSLKGSVIQYS